MIPSSFTQMLCEGATVSDRRRRVSAPLPYRVRYLFGLLTGDASRRRQRLETVAPYNPIFL